MDGVFLKRAPISARSYAWYASDCGWNGMRVNIEDILP